MIKLLDCTLRDGGYYTNWDFDKELVKQYLSMIEKLPIDYIEVGYRSDMSNNYLGEYFYLPLDTLGFIKDNSTKKIAIMLNAKEFYKKIDLKLLDEINKYIDLIRIATDPNRIDFSLYLAKEIKKLGFNVALNIMYISKIDKNHKFYNYIDEINQTVDILNLVDSYGSMYPTDLDNFIKHIKSNIKIPLGFHGHNNLELAFANSLIAIENRVEYIDSTILGMGRGAGNLKTELILTYLKNRNNSNIDLNTLSKLIDIFKPLFGKYKWGTNLAYMISGKYSLPQKDVMEALEINRYSIGSIINKLTDNIKTLKRYFPKHNYDNVLIIGGGDNIRKHLTSIKKFLKINSNILIIHSTSKFIDMFEDIVNYQIFAIAGDELLKLEKIPKNINEFITYPNPINFSMEIDNLYELENIDFTNYNDSPLSISLMITKLLKAKNIYLVGYDGYSSLLNKKELILMQENQNIINSFDETLVSLTTTNYKNLINKSIYWYIK